jgi:hypothetical protein
MLRSAPQALTQAEADMKGLKDPWNYVLAILVALVAIGGGLFVGWLVGESREPAVSGVIALIPTSLVGLGLAYFERRREQETLQKTIMEGGEKCGIDKAQLDKLKTSLIEQGRPSHGHVAFLLICILLSLGFGYWGIFLGIGFRVPSYPPLADLIENKNATPEEWGALHELRWHLRNNLVSKEEARSLFAKSINPILASPEKGCGCGCSMSRLFRLRAVVDRLLAYKLNPPATPCGSEFPGHVQPPPLPQAHEKKQGKGE